MAAAGSASAHRGHMHRHHHMMHHPHHMLVCTLIRPRRLSRRGAFAGEDPALPTQARHPRARWSTCVSLRRTLEIGPATIAGAVFGISCRVANGCGPDDFRTARSQPASGCGAKLPPKPTRTRARRMSPSARPWRTSTQIESRFERHGHGGPPHGRYGSVLNRHRPRFRVHRLDHAHAGAGPDRRARAHGHALHGQTKMIRSVAGTTIFSRSAARGRYSNWPE